MSSADGCWVYILECADGSYYVGLTHQDPDTRLSEHNSGKHRGYTYRRRPVSMVFASHFSVITDAQAFETQIKGWARAKKEALIAGRFDLLPDLSRAGVKRR
jgi:putative endonuclease